MHCSMAVFALSVLCPWLDLQPLDPWSQGLFYVEFAKPNGDTIAAAATDTWDAVRDWRKGRAVAVEYTGAPGSFRLRGDRPLRAVVTLEQAADSLRYRLDLSGTNGCTLTHCEFPRVAIGHGIGVGLPSGARYLRRKSPPGIIVLWDTVGQQPEQPYRTGTITFRRASL